MQPKYIILTTILRQEDDIWSAECKELGTASCGDTFEEARANLREAIGLHLNTLEDVGECERFLKENNIKTYTNIPKRISARIPIEPNIFVNREITPLPHPVYC